MRKKIYCPNCKSANLVPIISRRKAKKKVSMGKLFLGAVTMGISLPHTGIRNCENNYFCQNCGLEFFK